MRLQTLHGNSVPELLARARAELGPEVVLVSMRTVDSPLGRLEALVAKSAEDASFDEFYRESVAPATRAEAAEPPSAPATPEPAPAASRPALADRGRRLFARMAPTPDSPAKPGRPRRSGPKVIAFVGPTGAGKTTTLAKLLHHPDFFPGEKLAVITLDTYRVGGAAQLETWARLARVPFHPVLDPLQAARTLRRLGRVDTVLVDTPGRGPKEREDEEAVLRSLRALEPDEVHLVMPVGLSPTLAWRWIERAREYGATHILPTKTDEFTGAESLGVLGERAGLSPRWMAGGQRVPDDVVSVLRAGVPVREAAPMPAAAGV